MDELSAKRLGKINSDLSRLNSSLFEGEVAYQYLETVKTEHGELLIKGNAEGLIYAPPHAFIYPLYFLHCVRFCILGFLL